MPDLAPHNIKAIETSYGGCRFRSRLEARWAVFFDALGIAWEYEPEGYVLSDGTCYLPDFWLPRHGKFVEVKPEGGDFTKAQLLGQLTKKYVLCAEGVPGEGRYALAGGRFKGAWTSFNDTFWWCSSCTDFSALDCISDNPFDFVESRIRSAVSAAKSARFGT